MTALVETTLTRPAPGGLFGLGHLNRHRGVVRLGMGLAILWFVYWTCAYVVDPYTSLTPEPATLALRVMAWGVLVPCLMAGLGLAYWIAAGFRSDN